MRIAVRFTEIDSVIPVSFGAVTEVKNGFTQDEVDKLTEAAQEDGAALGRQAEWGEFWDSFQDYGKRNNYIQAFGNTWNDDIFKPKYNIVATDCARMFQNSNIINLKDILEEFDVVLDISKCKGTTQMFQSCNTKSIPVLDVTGATTINYMFASDKIRTIEKLIITENTPFSESVFQGAAMLKDIDFDGIIGKSIWFQHSPYLSRVSMESVITHLSHTAAGQTATFRLDAANSAFETEPGAADGSTTQAWLDLIGTKPNWTISLV